MAAFVFSTTSAGLCRADPMGCRQQFLQFWRSVVGRDVAIAVTGQDLAGFNRYCRRAQPAAEGGPGYGGPRPTAGHGPHYYSLTILDIHALDAAVEGEPSREAFPEHYGDNVREQNRLVGICERGCCARLRCDTVAARVSLPVV